MYKKKLGKLIERQDSKNTFFRLKVKLNGDLLPASPFVQMGEISAGKQAMSDMRPLFSLQLKKFFNWTMS
jgi:hypothetical protein